MRPGAGRQQGVRIGAEREQVAGAVAQEARGDRRPDEAGDDQEDDVHTARDRDPVLLEAEPDLLPVPTGGDRLEAFAQLRARLDRDRRSQPRTGRDHVGILARGHS